MRLSTPASPDVSSPGAVAGPAAPVDGGEPQGPDDAATAAAPRGRLARTWSTALGTVGAYVALTKPRVIELLLITTIPTMFLAARGMPSLALVAATLVGGAGAAGAANTLNQYLEHDIDAVMNRTRRRPIVTGRITPRAALVFGLVLGAVSLTWMWVVVNPASAMWTASAILIYVVGYTMILKRRTPQNIVWGGAAGCMPVVIGWSAVTGGISWEAVLLFGVVFFWTPPHYWPLSMKFRRDYAAAGVPMLPVVAADTRVARQMILYTLAMIACSLLLVPVGGMTWVYAAVAAALGAWFLWLCVGLLRRARDPRHPPLRAMTVFHGSITYLTLLSVAVAVDVFLPL